eukprot:2254697-Ditylum_brightwellii.AAC.1
MQQRKIQMTLSMGLTNYYVVWWTQNRTKNRRSNLILKNIISVTAGKRRPDQSILDFQLDSRTPQPHSRPP